MDPLKGFEFSQSSLQDFVDCRRRFQYRYLQRLAWPALQAEPARENERHIQRGERFHRLAQQYLLGVPADLLARLAEADEDENLQRWWQNFMECIPEELAGERHVEATLAAPLNGFRLVAKFDLVLVRPDGRIRIYDWKTSTRRPRAQTLRERMQTRVYPYLLVQAGAIFNHNCPVEPEQVEMIYWFAEPAQAPEVLSYNRARWQADGSALHALVGEIRALEPDRFELCADEGACRFCVYRSLCDRGTQPGEDSEGALEYDRLEDLDFSLEQIAEVDF
jgi:hypothetical protein